jgi:wobble nucleotide-excising tRNase
MSTKKLSAIIQISELDQMLTDLKQAIEQRDSKIARLQQMISEKRQSAVGYRDFIVLKNSQEELRELCKKIDLQLVKTNELLRHIRNTKVIFSDLLLLEAEVNEQMSKIQELSNAFFIQEEAGK